ncbi:MAG: dipeptidase PepE [Prolixibacteraceae bacterium]|jgi:dipeptidase E|nr:dipeptidase PepE [Prolixibacteraceae bacterium]MBT6006016.1 dipeptidase PepE [Prolixibacteraceae bacterium]MBT6766346.1 dipeptidase PepE [Prolixibacteraceae bacterium]MBT6999676.1 dipeptidase PepE [Prolixibacteraceae bacterium]MBT7395030.1 dipeptidase PepE [Prolixibacteraceae bacterium]
MKLLLISNSTMKGEPYLDYPKYEIQKFLGEKSVTAVFIPFAAVTFSFDLYCKKVEERFAEVGHHIVGIHTFADPIKAIQNADAIVVGGGNTWQLVRMMHDQNIMDPIREKVEAGTPYIGWSAGSNVACPTLRTTNDMPIIDPLSFDCTGLVPFQINPHYLDANPEDHGGETREQRIEEFLEINPDLYVTGLREGTMFKLENEKLELIGDRQCRIFKKGKNPFELSAGDDFNFLL